MKASQKKKGNGKQVSTDFLERPSEAQPSPLEKISLAPGVVFKAGPAVRAGPEPPVDPSHMTRGQFASFAAGKKREAELADVKRRGAVARRSEGEVFGSRNQRGVLPAAKGSDRNADGASAARDPLGSDKHGGVILAHRFGKFYNDNIVFCMLLHLVSIGGSVAVRLYVYLD